MSGQATGWVLRHGPTDRAMRCVLLCISDAANADGHHAHPGMEALMRGSLYKRSHVLATLRKLKAEGWITETAPRSPGHAATYSIPGVSEVQPVDARKVQPVDLRPERGPIPEPLRSNPERPEVQSEGSSLYGSTLSTVETNEVQPLAPAASERTPESKALDDEAHRLAVLAHEQTPRPNTRGGFPAVLCRCREALEAGHTPEHIAATIKAGKVSAWTRDAFSLALNRAPATNGSRSSYLDRVPGQAPLMERLAAMANGNGQRELPEVTR